MKIKKTVPEKTIAANKANAHKSTGPRTDAGKGRAQVNSLKHGFFAKELQLSEEEQPEFEALRDGLLQQYAPATPMQQIAFEKISCCCWRCKIALRMESRAVALQQSSNKEPNVETAGGDTNRMEQWYGANRRSLQDGWRFLRELLAIVADSGLLHLQEEGPLKESLLKGWGPDFYNSLTEWKGTSARSLALAEHLDYMMKTFNMNPPIGLLGGNPEHRAAISETPGPKPPVVDPSLRDPEHPVAGRVTFNLTPPPTDPRPAGLEDLERPKVVADPAFQKQMVVKLIKVEMGHLDMLDRTRGQDFGETPQALAEFSPRYFADASRALERAVDWFLKLKEKGL